MIDSEKVLFREEQRFGRWLVAAFGAAFLAALGLFGFGIWQQIGRGRPFGDRPGSDAQLVAIAALVLGLLAAALYVFGRGRLLTEVRTDGVHVRFFPYHRSFRHFRIEEIGCCEAIRYHPLLEYGGHGILWSLRGTIWSAGGNRAVRLTFSDRPRLLIGSQRPEEFVQAVEEARRRVRPGRWS